ncbi:O-methyltransferase [Polyangium sorediatum]|uniref:Class I SAM-dependent methyltransferase n=1 Tax=Polyangium sorediatum TaxID=889274 RepID=A0ABT6P9R3_9BACT|nr:class I SAM-dependent methyltransferase [Polyangium sorediatum]MDI1437367.1 class I SAM-dependent methyltransferase [Polyangium sorediatum]
MDTTTASPNSLNRADVRDLLDRLHRRARGDYLKLPFKVPALAKGLLRGQTVTEIFMAGAARDLYLPVSPEQGRFLYLMARTVGARSIVEFGTSFGLSTLYLAAAVTDNGGGKVIGTELEPGKHAVATDNLRVAGFGEVAEVRLGDALQTLRDVPGPVDMVLLDGWKDLYMPVLELLKPKLRKGSVVLADNIFTFKKALRPFVEYMQSGKNGFQSTTLSIADGFEYSYYEGA